MKIVGFLVCGNGEADRYLEGTLKEFKRLCDDAVVATNNADQKTKDLIKKYGFWQYEDNREWGREQQNIKTLLLEKVARLSPDFIVALDADEVFAPTFTREDIERLGETNEIAWYFLVINLYNDDQHYAHDRGIQRFWNVRLYRFRSDLRGGFLNQALHCGLAPAAYYNFGWHAPYYLLHYGLMKPEDRARKAERYRKYDPTAKYKDKVYYDDLERELEMRPFDGEALLKKLAESVDCQPRKTPTLTNQNGQSMKYIYVKRLKDGRVIDIPETDYEATMKTGNFELVGEADMGIKIETPAGPATFTCPLCGKESKTETLLKMHKGKVHK